MKNVKLELTVEELALVTSLASDQLFRKEFIDPKMPGYKADPAELAMGKDLVVRLRSIVKQASESSAGSISRRAPSHLSRNPNGIPDAV
ncbi:MAG TPA: hypothetical protein VLW65_20735 [Bryobacteraceae bacterium]|nr:hypothetical protein [Bryobacteraceae bacterium]